MITYLLPTFLDAEPIPVELVSELESYAVQGASVVLRCKTLRYNPIIFNYYGTPVETVFDAPTPGAVVTIQLDFCTADIVRVRIAHGESIPAHDTPMVVNDFADRIMPKINENDKSVSFQTDALHIEVTREPFQLRAFNADGTLLFATKPIDIDALRRPTDQWNPPQQRWIFLHRYAYPLGFSDRQHAFISCDLRHDEHIYGFGESYGRIDKRDTPQTLWIQEAFGNASPATYKRTPFYMSTRGYGLFLNSANAIRAHIGDREHSALSLIVDATDLLDFYLINGPHLTDILPRYTSITGAPAIPPYWSFGLWMSRITYTSRAQVEEVAAKLRERRIPCDVIHLDTGWYENDWECDLKFGETNFPQPEVMLANLREQGFKVSVWQWPNVTITSPMFAEASDNGYLVKRANGQPYLMSGFAPEAGYIDYSNPAAVAWIQEKFRALFRLGVAAIKVDFGEGAQPDAVYHGMSGAEAHNLYPLLYNKAIFEVTEEYFGKGNALIWARSAWAGSQRYPIHWSGDGVARYEDLASVLRAMLNMGLSGFPFYSHDIGGFSGLPDPALFIRWAQLGFFSSHARIHGTPPREPWEFGEEAERIFREFDELRYRLLPYIYSEALECGKSSLPMVRALVLDYQDDPTVYGIEDQYLFGRSILVAPILNDSTRRRVYLPRGKWFDYWTKQAVEGPCWLTVNAPLDRIPLYIKDGAAIPYGPLIQHTAERPAL